MDYSSVPQTRPPAHDEHSSLTEKDNTCTESTKAIELRGTKTSSSFGNVFRIWWLEALLLLLMLATLAAICITTWRYQDKPVPKWPFKVSVNTLNSVYGVVLKSTIVVVVSAGLSQLKWTWYKKSRPLRDIEYWDQASRGTLGSLLLIWHLRGRHIIATIGALVVILALALDPFVQLLVLYDNCSINRGGEQAFIPTRNSYAETNGGMTTAYYVPTALGHAANAGILGAAVSEVSATCQTGNCTFSEPYHTIAFCSQCEDISDAMSWECIENYGNSTMGACNATVPGGFYNSVTVADETNAWEPVLSFSVQNSPAIGYSLVIMANNLTTTPGLQVLDSQQCSTEENDMSWQCRGYGAANCSVFPCVTTYQARVDNGRLQESLVGSFAELIFGLIDDNFTYSALDVKCVTSEVRDQLAQQLDYPIDANTDWIGYRGADDGGRPYTWYQTNMKWGNKNWTSGPVIDVPPQCVYSIFSDTAEATGQYIVDTAKGSVTVEEGGADYVGDIIPRSLFNSGNVSFDLFDSSFASMATAMTVYLRQATYMDWNTNTTSAPNATHGTAFQVETCMRVRWLYIIYPATLSALTLVFFVGMVLQTFTWDEIHDWKDSALALIFHGMMHASSGNEAFEAPEIGTREEMNKVAKKICVAFGPDETDEREMSQLWECSDETGHPVETVHVMNTAKDGTNHDEIHERA